MGFAVDAYTSVVAEGHRRGDEVTAAMAARLRADGLAASTVTVEGPAAAAISTKPSPGEPTLSSSAPAATGSLKRLLLGSTARSVLHHADASVLITRPTRTSVREPDRRASRSTRSPRRLCRCGSSLRPTRPASSSPASASTCTARPRRRRSCSRRWSIARPELRDVSVVHLHTEGPGPHLAPEMAGHFRHRALFIGPNARAAVNEGRADYVPVFLSDVPRLFESGALPLDVVFVNATPPDAHGFCSLGTSVEAMHAAIRAAKTVVVQLNRSMPRTLGDSFIHVDDIDLGGRGRRPAVRPRQPGHRRRRASGSARTSPSSCRTGRRSSSGSARSRRRRRWP